MPLASTVRCVTSVIIGPCQQAFGDPHAQPQRHVPHLAHLTQRAEAGAQIRRQRARMVGGAGVHRHAARALPPDRVNRTAQERIADAGADRVRHQAEVAQVDVRPAAAVELEEFQPAGRRVYSTWIDTVGSRSSIASSWSGMVRRSHHT